MTRYRLGSDTFVHAPGIIAWAINGYAFKKDREHLEKLMCSTWAMPTEASKALLSGAVYYTVEGDVVVFEA